MDLFETATRKKLRFASSKGDLTVEQVWDLPLTGKGVNLDQLAIASHRDLKSVEEESFVSRAPHPMKATFSLRLEILKHIIGVKMEEAAAAQEKAAKAEKKAQILEALADSEKQELAGKGADELRKMLADM